MGLSVTEKENIKELVEKRINREIERISTENKEAMDDIRKTARQQAVAALGVGPKIQQVIALREQIAQLEADKTKLEAEIVTDLNIQEARDHYSSYRQTSEVKIEHKLQAASASYERALLAAHPQLGRILILRNELENLLQNIWIATSNAQVKALFDAVNNLLGSQSTPFEAMAQAIPADQTN